MNFTKAGQFRLDAQLSNFQITLLVSFFRLFQLGPDMTQIGVFHYNRAVVTSRQIFLNEYTSNELTRFQRDITTLPYREQS